MRAVLETLEGLAYVFGAFLLTATPLAVLWLTTDNGDAIWGIAILATLAVWILGGLLAAVWRRLIS